MSDQILRSQANSKQFGSVQELAKFCDRIQGGWFRCQALAGGAVSLPKLDRVQACQSTITAANTEKDEYKKQAAQVWVVDALYSSGFHKEATKLANQLIDSSHKIIPSNSQGYMLGLLFERCRPDDIDVSKRIATTLMGLYESKGGWRVGQAFESAMWRLKSSTHDKFVEDLLRKCTDERLIRKVCRIRERPS